MNRYIMIRRLKGPAILLLAGIILLLHEVDLVEFWGLFLPLLLILIGVLKLAERAALAAAGDDALYPGGPFPYGTAPAVATAPQAQPGAIIPAHPQGFGKDPEGGQS